MAKTQADLYEAYLRSALPSAAARSLLRRLAWLMGEEFKPVLLRSEYERITEGLAQQLGLSVSLVDDLLNNRLFEINADTVTFEHDLIKDYLRAQQLVRDTEPRQLAIRLSEPKYSGLTEFVVSSSTDSFFLEDALGTAKPDLLSKAFRGWLGTQAKDLVRAQCKRVLAECREQPATS